MRSVETDKIFLVRVVSTLMYHSHIFLVVILRCCELISGPGGTKGGFQPECSICDMTFASLEAFSRHCNEKHIFKCYRCGEKWSSKDLLQKHFHDEHKDEKEDCQLCDETVRTLEWK